MDGPEKLNFEIVEDILALKDRFPHFQNIDRSHFKDGTLEYENGKRKVPNLKFDEEFDAWEVQEERRERERQEGIARKQHFVPKPERELTIWNEEDGIRLRMNLWRIEPYADDPARMRAGVLIPVPGFGDIHLEDAAGSFEARLGDLRVSLSMEGGSRVGEIREAIFRLLQKRNPAS